MPHLNPNLRQFLRKVPLYEDGLLRAYHTPNARFFGRRCLHFVCACFVSEIEEFYQLIFAPIHTRKNSTIGSDFFGAEIGVMIFIGCDFGFQSRECVMKPANNPNSFTETRFFAQPSDSFFASSLIPFTSASVRLSVSSVSSQFISCKGSARKQWCGHSGECTVVCEQWFPGLHPPVGKHSSIDRLISSASASRMSSGPLFPASCLHQFRMWCAAR